MRNNSERRRRRTTSEILIELVTDGESITVVGQGGGFHDCPLCRELASQPGGATAFVDLRRESLPLLERIGWLDSLHDLVGPNATVRVMGSDQEAEPLEELPIETFLARLGYE